MAVGRGVGVTGEGNLYYCSNFGRNGAVSPLTHYSFNARRSWPSYVHHAECRRVGRSNLETPVEWICSYVPPCRSAVAAHGSDVTYSTLSRDGGDFIRLSDHPVPSLAFDNDLIP